MGLFDKIRGVTRSADKPAAKKNHEVEAGPTVTLLAPVAGETVAIADMSDACFANGFLGEGMAVLPAGEPDGPCDALAPATGTVSAVALGAHALTITTDEGLGVLLHVGIDTFELEGRGFSRYVQKGERAVAGQPVMSFDRSEIARANCEDIIAVTVPATTEGTARVTWLAQGGAHVEAGEPIARVEPVAPARPVAPADPSETA